MRVGYIQTSKKDQNPDLRRREFEEFGFFRRYLPSRKLGEES
jgi:hypothetical protein